MLEGIRSIFVENGFNEKGVEGANLYSRKKDDRKQEFWLVIKPDDVGELLASQSDFFEKSKQAQQDPAFDKNVSMLVLWETDGGIPHEELKKKILAIEEDAYFFKKYVLYYSSSQLKRLYEASDGLSLNNFVAQQVQSQEVFARYKKIDGSSDKNNYWEPLLYRIAMKIPFIFIDAGERLSLSSLFADNQVVIDRKGGNLAKFDARFFNLDLDALLDEAATAEKLLDALLEVQNVDQD